jgi:hypothetical protein
MWQRRAESDVPHQTRSAVEGVELREADDAVGGTGGIDGRSPNADTPAGNRYEPAPPARRPDAMMRFGSSKAAAGRSGDADVCIIWVWLFHDDAPPAMTRSVGLPA